MWQFLTCSLKANERERALLPPCQCRLTWEVARDPVLSARYGHERICSSQQLHFTYIHMYIHIYIYLYICVYIYVYICIYTYIYICVCVYVPSACKPPSSHRQVTVFGGRCFELYHSIWGRSRLCSHLTSYPNTII